MVFGFERGFWFSREEIQDMRANGVPGFAQFPAFQNYMKEFEGALEEDIVLYGRQAALLVSRALQFHNVTIQEQQLVSHSLE